MPYAFLVGWLCVALALSYLLGRVWAAILGRFYRYVVAPGVIVHELSHAFGCMITGATVTHLSLLDAGGGSVAYTKPRIPVLGDVVISLAPIACGIAFVWGLCCLATGGNPLGFPLLPLDIQLSPEGFGAFVRQAFEPVWAAGRYLCAAQYRNVGTYIFLYLIATIILTWSPSRRDMGHAATGLAAIAVLGVVLHSLARTVRNQTSLNRAVMSPILPVITFMFATTCVLASVTLAVWTVGLALRYMKDRASRGRTEE